MVDLIDAGSAFIKSAGRALAAVCVRVGPGAGRAYAEAVVPCRIDGLGAEAQAVPETQPVGVTVQIANAGSLSPAVKIDGRLVGLLLPAGWTAAALTFQGSVDGTNFFDIYDAGTERTIAQANVVANRFLALNPNDFRAFTHVKLRSGASGAAVAQGAARTFTLVKA